MRLPRSAMRCRRSASSVVIAAAGIFGASRGVLQRAGVRRAQPGGSDRADQRRRRRRGARRATARRRETDGFAVVGERDVEQHDAAARAVAPWHPAPRSCGRPALRPGCRRRRPVPTLSPSPSMTIACRAGSTISALSAPRTHFGTMTLSVCTFSRPSRFISATAHCDRAIERRRAAQPVADRVGENGEAMPGERAADRFANQARGRLAVRVEPVCRGTLAGSHMRCLRAWRGSNEQYKGQSKGDCAAPSHATNLQDCQQYFMWSTPCTRREQRREQTPSWDGD